MTPQQEIEALIAQVALGDRSAFRDLYQRTSAKLFGVCLRVLNDRAEAEEALQEVFLRVWDKAGMYQVNGLSPMTWLITIARNLSVDRRRARRDPAGGLDAAEVVADSAPGPEAQAVARSDVVALNACLDGLPDGKGDMLRRVYLDGASYATLASETGARLNTIRTWLRRGLAALKECLEQ
ncbi:sigma-70 family RNA polymerase sigma factor [Mesobacterium sp. TK19101]|uniref:Sigma-70 family RNA polymerase sigma factor n=1 Tax=Mesobacterium hydrothermale TaxID=3111907 RepID=A0ABU6HJA6_9RHOB|nr:sigma-70 family RNA polymerase sigma factor [Mesobacterium sp. TK19101]MEC3861925.1 sigma-70 family RNA polymerase sigma factor [Mesobacterium sp. TK19101]